MSGAINFKSIIRDVPDLPHEGILFRDITPVLLDPACFNEAINRLAETARGLDFKYIAGPESRGFIFGTPLAAKLNKGFIPIRKAGKLPGKTVKTAYSLEYGEAELEMTDGVINKGDKVLVVDDLLATGGTCAAICKLMEEVGATVSGCVFFIELTGLNGRELLGKYNPLSVVKY